MESLIIDKENIINKIDNIISELKDIKSKINIDIELDNIINIEDIKEDQNHKESTKTLLSPKKQKIDLNQGYTDFYDINGRPEISI